MRLSVGPAPSNWGEEKLRSFYRELARCPVDSVSLGETACPVRSCFGADLVDEICAELRRENKSVYASSLVLVKDRKGYRDFSELARQVEQIEINSPAFLSMAQCYPAAVGGMFLNVYNSSAARILTEYKVRRIVLPCELDLRSIASIAKGSNAAIEVVVHGYVPIATSYTCPTARCFGRGDSECAQVCREYPDGMILEAGDRPIFRIEGPRTLSAATYCLVEYLGELEKARVDTVRVLPQWEHTASILQIYRDVLDNRRESRDALAELRDLSPTSFCNGWFLGQAGWTYESPN